MSECHTVIIHYSTVDYKMAPFHGTTLPAEGPGVETQRWLGLVGAWWYATYIKM